MCLSILLLSENCVGVIGERVGESREESEWRGVLEKRFGFGGKILSSNMRDSLQNELL